MPREPYYFRPSMYNYRVQSHPEYYFRVGRSDGTQAIWGLTGPDLQILLFTEAGELKTVNSSKLADAGLPGSPVDYDEALQAASAFVLSKFQITEQAVTVKRFWLEELNIGIEDVTDNLKEYLLNPLAFDEEERADAEDSLRWWKSEGQFVFWWEQSFYMSEEGWAETS